MSNATKGLANPSLTPERRREIARLGGRAAHAKGTAHKWTSEEAARAGRVGGRISRRKPMRRDIPDEIA